MRKDRSYAEVYNDLDGEVVNVFRVLREPLAAERLKKLCELTPFARDEFELSYKESDDPVEQARRTIFRSFAGFGSAAILKSSRTGFRSCSNRSGTTPSHDWANLAAFIPSWSERFMGVVIENRNGLLVMNTHDSDETLHYVDPPYVKSTRRQGSSQWDDAYQFEMDDEAHLELLVCLSELKGMVMLSGYRCALYDDLLQGWQRIDRKAHADGSLARVESLWLNPAAQSRYQPSIFGDNE